MSSQVYLFEPSNASRSSGHKSLVQILREAEHARSHESARYIRDAFRHLTGLLRPKKSATVVTTARPAEDRRLAA